MVGWIDFALLFWPPRFGVAEWEVSVIARTFDSMPLPTMGLVLLVVGIRAKGGPRWPSRSVAALLACVALAVVLSLGLITLDLPVMVRTIRSAPAGQPAGAVMMAGLKRVILKAYLFGAGYLALYGWMAVKVWRIPAPSHPR